MGNIQNAPIEILLKRMHKADAKTEYNLKEKERLKVEGDIFRNSEQERKRKFIAQRKRGFNSW